MLDFLTITARSGSKRNTVEVIPQYATYKSRIRDLMIRGGDFYAVYDEANNIWSQEEDTALRLIDQELSAQSKAGEEWYKKIFIERVATINDCPKECRTLVQNFGELFHGETPKYRVLYLWDSNSGMIERWHKYVKEQLRDSYTMLDSTITFQNTDICRESFVSKRLPYSISEAHTPAYELIMSTLYSPEERLKIEWAIGAIISGEAKNIQKFLVLYGPPGSGKSTVLNIILELFKGPEEHGYCTVFDAKSIGNGDAFSLEPFANNPLVAIQHDGKLSKIKDNTKLNSLVSHELQPLNMKNKSIFAAKFNCLLFMGTNEPVEITDSKSGLLRRLIDVSPSGNKLTPRKYTEAMKNVSFELGGIAYHCLQVFLQHKHDFDTYIPVTMMAASNDFYTFMSDSYLFFENNSDGITLQDAYSHYISYCENARFTPMNRRLFGEELKSYFTEFTERKRTDDGRVRNFYQGFTFEKFERQAKNDIPEEPVNWLSFSEDNASFFDTMARGYPAQYSTPAPDEHPICKWSRCTTALADINTSELHFCKVPEEHIVIDFDIPDEEGNKCLERNLEAAAKWPPTYAELSKSGQGIHLHYIYAGDPSRLSRIFDDHIEIKVFVGNSALRRKLTKCNDRQISVISNALPLKKEKIRPMNDSTYMDERRLRKLIDRCLNKEWGSTTVNMNFIGKLVAEAYEQGGTYDISDLRETIEEFAKNSTHQKEKCLAIFDELKFISGEPPMVIFDVEVFPNYFCLCWKRYNVDEPVKKLINPSPRMVSFVMGFRLAGFNNRNYDNHIIYARAKYGESNEQLYYRSQGIINGDERCKIPEAYGISEVDIYDMSSKKQSLKRFEIELAKKGKLVRHVENSYPWDQPLPEEGWAEVADYCANDVLATEAVLNDRYGDFIARQILADLSGLSVNDKTNKHTQYIIFGSEEHPELVYTDLAEEFPGYEYVVVDLGPDKNGIHKYSYRNMFRGADMGFGGLVYANHGCYKRTITFDVASMHPSSIIQLNLFGRYTKNFKDLLDARLYIKHKDYESAKELFGGKLSKYLDDPAQAKALSQALKIAINSVYGLTSAKFDNPFRDPRNSNNIVALRGALFMYTLKDEVEARGFKVAHIKTDSIKVVEPTQEIMDFIFEFGQKYGYTFEIEHIFEKICLTNNAVYIAKLAEDDPEEPGQWTATGDEFKEPYIFKSLFSKEPIEFSDLCITASCQTALYLDFNECLGPNEHARLFVGKVGNFVPVSPGCGGGELVRQQGEKYNYVGGTTGWRFKIAEAVKEAGEEDQIDKRYFQALVDGAIDDIRKTCALETSQITDAEIFMEV